LGAALAATAAAPFQYSREPCYIPCRQIKVSFMISFLREFWRFMRVRKKFWLLPICIVLGLLGGLAVFTHGSAVAPFIYALF
jgi:Family of unknown function (DUF5989)